MTTQEVANRLAQLCREGKYEQVYEEFYTSETLSLEPEGSPYKPAKGLDEMREKGKQWEKMVDSVLSSEISDPVVADNFFSLAMKTKVKLKGGSDPVNMDEICVYNVVDGKVVSEQFFYTPAF